MGFFSKKDKVPELPPAPRIPEIPNTSVKTMSELPSLPKNLNENFNQEMVKSAVNDSDSSGEISEVEMEELPRDFHFKESISNARETSSIPDVPYMPQKQTSMQTIQPKPLPQYNSVQMQPIPAMNKHVENSVPGTIFVRFDKFQNAKKEFENINKSLKDIESLLDGIKDTNAEENSDISNLDRELNEIKAKLAELDSSIFDRV